MTSNSEIQKKKKKRKSKKKKKKKKRRKGEVAQGRLKIFINIMSGEKNEWIR